MKKIVSIILSTVLIIMGNSIPILASSSTDSSQYINSANIGVSPYEPSDISPNGTGIPSKVWDISDDGRYDFAGNSYEQPLYTEYKLTGKDSYTIHITNNSNYKLTVKVKTRTHTYSTNTLAANTTSDYSVTGMKASTKFYIYFAGASQDFSGYIE